MATLLEVKGIYKSFGGHEVLKDVNLKIEELTIHALIGPNGAGKTTLLNIINGIERADRGNIYLLNMDITNYTVEARARVGLGRTFQLLEVFSGLTVLENILTALFAKNPWGMIKSMLFGERFHPVEGQLKRRALEYLEFVNLSHRADEEVQNLPAGEQKLLEIARALALEPKILLLDEPAAGLNNRETRILGEILKKICREKGITILLVEHDMELVMRVSDLITVLNFGEVLAEGPPTLIQKDPRVIKAYLGEDF